jgi:hypothetical protein
MCSSHQIALERSGMHMLWFYLACKEEWEEIVDTKKVGGDGGGRYWNSLLSGERSSKCHVLEIAVP